jgi:hypothetical protein
MREAHSEIAFAAEKQNARNGRSITNRGPSGHCGSASELSTRGYGNLITKILKAAYAIQLWWPSRHQMHYH